MDDDDIRKLRRDADVMAGYFRIEAQIPVSRIVDWLNEDHVPKEKEMVWIYDGCDCIPTGGSRSVPYCENHWNPLVRVEKEI